MASVQLQVNVTSNVILPGEYRVVHRLDDTFHVISGRLSQACYRLVYIFVQLLCSVFMLLITIKLYPYINSFLSPFQIQSQNIQIYQNDPFFFKGKRNYSVCCLMMLDIQEQRLYQGRISLRSVTPPSCDLSYLL